MKIIFLNIWNAKVREPLLSFLGEHAADTDIFCLQEVPEAVRPLIREVLPEHAEVTFSKYVYNDHFNQAIYIKKEISLRGSGPAMEHDDGVGLGLFAEIPFGANSLHICNVHGISQPGEKLDTPDRLRQSEALIAAFADKPGPKIIGGDFNILEKTESIGMFEKNGYRDLIKDFRITTTRNRFAWELYPGNELYYSDYVFTSADVEVKRFSVPSCEISDHLPLILDIG